MIGGSKDSSVNQPRMSSILIISILLIRSEEQYEQQIKVLLYHTLRFQFLHHFVNYKLYIIILIYYELESQ